MLVCLTTIIIEHAELLKSPQTVTAENWHVLILTVSRTGSTMVPSDRANIPLFVWSQFAVKKTDWNWVPDLPFLWGQRPDWHKVTWELRSVIPNGIWFRQTIAGCTLHTDQWT